MRSQFEQKQGHAFDLTIPDFDLETVDSGHIQASDNAGVEVRIERTVRFEKNTKGYELENYSRGTTASAGSIRPSAVRRS
jgi:hypothetical protein